MTAHPEGPLSAEELATPFSAELRDLAESVLHGNYTFQRDLAFKARAAAQTIDALSADKERLRGLLRHIEWAYPPADAVRSSVEPGTWRGPARCPKCLAEHPGPHIVGCALAEALR